MTTKFNAQRLEKMTLSDKERIAEDLFERERTYLRADVQDFLDEILAEAVVINGQLYVNTKVIIDKAGEGLTNGNI